METNSTNKWKRWTEAGFFPKPKYGFTQHLEYIGDSLTTHPLEYAEYIRFKDAAKFWAWRHDKRVTIRTDRKPNNMRSITVTLVAHHRKDNHRVLPDGLKDGLEIEF